MPTTLTSPDPTPSPHLPTSRSGEGRVLVAGFAAAVAVWSAWFITHLPWLGISEQVSMPILLATWLVMATLAFRIAGASPAGDQPGGGWRFGIGSGVIAALLGLLILGSKLSEAEPGAAALRPSTGLIALGFLALGGAIGAAGTLLARLLPPSLTRSRSELYAPARLAIVAIIAVAPLLFVGGLVTSTNSGMAVPDWPNTYGSNMFLYPLGPRAAPDVYLEHSHRLFGALAGLTTLALMVLTIRADERRWVRRWAIAVFALVCVQGILGGARVLWGSADAAADNRLYAMLHGVLAQFVFAMLVALAVFLSPVYRRLTLRRDSADRPLADPSIPRRLRILATGATHATLLQLILGAAYRHFRADHALWTHAAFSVVVVIFAAAAGFMAASLPRDAGRPAAILRLAGIGLVAVVIAQFTLGWITFFIGGRGLEAATVLQALVRTLHQANGALLLALATTAYMWARAAAPRGATVPSAVTPAPAVPAGA